MSQKPAVPLDNPDRAGASSPGLGGRLGAGQSWEQEAPPHTLLSVRWAKTSPRPPAASHGLSGLLRRRVYRPPEDICKAGLL